MNYTYDFAKWHKRTFGTDITREQHRIIASLEHFRQRGITRRVLVHDDGSRGDLIRRTLVLYFEWLTTRVFPLLTAAVMAQSMKTLREVMPEYHRFNPYNFNRSTLRLHASCCCAGSYKSYKIYKSHKSHMTHISQQNALRPPLSSPSPTGKRPP